MISSCRAYYVCVRSGWLCGLLSVFCLVSCDREDAALAESVTRIKEIVQVGMDADEAIAALRNEGFAVGAKIKPTKKADYYQVNVVLRDSIPASETAKYILDVSSKTRSYLVIKASLDGRITSVE